MPIPHFYSRRAKYRKDILRSLESGYQIVFKNGKWTPSRFIGAILGLGCAPWRTPI